MISEEVKNKIKILYQQKKYEEVIDFTENECIKKNNCSNGSYGRNRIYKFKVKEYKK